MTGVKLATAYYELVPSTKGAQGDITREFGGIGTSASRSFGGTFSKGLKATVGPAIALLGTAAVGSFLKDSIGEAREAQKVGALTNNVIKQTGGVAKVSAKDVGRLSTAISNKTGIDDEAIQSGANLLLTFKNVRNETGKGAKIFDRATAAAADLSAAGFGDLAGTSKQLGKALNDPVKGIAALGRAGVTFTQGQKDQIKSMVASNDLLGAQKIILKEVESQVGGAAAASSTLGEKASVAFGNFKESIGTALLPVVDDLSRALIEKGVPAGERFADFFQTEALPAIKDFGEAAAPLAKSVLPAIGTALSVTADAAKALAPAVKSIVDSFNSLPKSVQTAIVLGGGAAYLGSKTGVLGPLVRKKSPAKTGAKAAEDVVGKLAPYSAVAGPQVAAAVAATAIATVGSYLVAKGIKDNLGKRPLPGNLGRSTGGQGDQRSQAVKDFQEKQAAANRIADAKKSEALFAENERKRQARLRATIDGYDLTKAKLGEVGGATDILGRKRPAPTVSTPGLSVALGGVIGLSKNLDILDNKVATPRIELGGNAGAQIGAIGASLDRLSSKAARIKIGANANGTNNWPGGLSLVGERGPELLNLPKHSQVVPASLTRTALNRKAGSPVATSGGSSDAVLRTVLSAFRKGFTIQSDSRGNQRLVLST